MRNACAMPNPLEHYKPSAEVCTELRIDRSTLSRWVAAGKLTPAFKLPGMRGGMYFAPEDVEALRSHKVAA
jgi:predicted site-specific integrase-resolvase